VRFLGRRVYAGIVVVLVWAVAHGLSQGRVRRLREALGIDSRTLERWRQWWLESFVQSKFWKQARSRILPAVNQALLPASLCERFNLKRHLGWVDLMRFLSPISTTWSSKNHAM